MNFEDNEKFGGYATIELIRDGADGPVTVHSETVHNLVLNTGKRQVWRVAAGLNSSVFDQMRIGTCGAAANSAQTNVLSPVTGSLVTVDQATLLSGTRTMQYVVSWPAGTGSLSAASIQEVCLLNQNTAPGGSAFMRSVFSSPVSKTTGDKVKVTYKVRVN